MHVYVPPNLLKCIKAFLVPLCAQGLKLKRMGDKDVKLEPQQEKISTHQSKDCSQNFLQCRKKKGERKDCGNYLKVMCLDMFHQLSPFHMYEGCFLEGQGVSL